MEILLVHINHKVHWIRNSILRKIFEAYKFCEIRYCFCVFPVYEIVALRNRFSCITYFIVGPRVCYEYLWSYMLEMNVCMLCVRCIDMISNFWINIYHQIISQNGQQYLCSIPSVQHDLETVDSNYFMEWIWYPSEEWFQLFSWTENEESGWMFNFHESQKFLIKSDSGKVSHYLRPKTVSWVNIFATFI